MKRIITAIWLLGSSATALASATPVPEPSSLGLFGAAALALVVLAKLKK